MSNPAPAIAGQQPERRANAPAQQQGGPVERVEARISDLHAKLQITPVQEPQFKAYADVMRSNAQSMQNLLQQQPQNTGMTAVDVLRSYERPTTTHAEALNKLVPAFEALYATLSAEQKKLLTPFSDRSRSGVLLARPDRQRGSIRRNHRLVRIQWSAALGGDDEASEKSG